jgi:hypothetical protein
VGTYKQIICIVTLRQRAHHRVVYESLLRDKSVQWNQPKSESRLGFMRLRIGLSQLLRSESYSGCWALLAWSELSGAHQFLARQSL